MKKYNIICQVPTSFIKSCYSNSKIQINACLYNVFLVLLSIPQKNIVTLTVSFPG